MPMPFVFGGWEINRSTPPVGHLQIRNSKNQIVAMINTLDLTEDEAEMVVRLIQRAPRMLELLKACQEPLEVFGNDYRVQVIREVVNYIEEWSGT